MVIDDKIKATPQLSWVLAILSTKYVMYRGELLSTFSRFIYIDVRRINKYQVLEYFVYTHETSIFTIKPSINRYFYDTTVFYHYLNIVCSRPTIMSPLS